MILFGIFSLVAIVHGSQNLTASQDEMLMEPCSDVNRGNRFTMITLARKTKLFLDILKALQLQELFKNREGVEKLLGNEEDCSPLTVPTQLSNSSRTKKTLLNMYGDLTAYSGIMTAIENRELAWITKGRLLQQDALDGKLRHYIKTNIYDIMCVIHSIVRRQNKINKVVQKNCRILGLNTEPICSLFQTVYALENFESYIESSVNVLREMIVQKKARKGRKRQRALTIPPEQNMQ